MRRIDADALKQDLLKRGFYPAIVKCALEAAPTIEQPTWISVDDRLPTEKVNCIVYYKHAYNDNDGYWAIDVCFYDGVEFKVNLAYKVTHWMPLPEPPKEG